MGSFPLLRCRSRARLRDLASSGLGDVHPKPCLSQTEESKGCMPGSRLACMHSSGLSQNEDMGHA